MADLSKLKRGKENMVQSGSGKGRYLPGIFWKEDKEIRFVAFLKPVNDVPKLMTHFILTANGWRTFVCRKNEIFEDENPNGECTICDDFKKKASWQWLATAVEMTPVEKRENGRKVTVGYEILMDEWEYEKDGKTEKATAPHIGIVSQSLSNFWTPLTAVVEREQMKNGYGDLDEVVYEIQRSGKGKKGTSYLFYASAPDERPDLSEYLDEFPTLEDWIEQKGSLEYYEEELSGGIESDDEDESGDTKPEPSRERGEQPEATSRFDELRSKLEAREEAEKTEAEEAEAKV